jgi:hypothetical protein
MEKVNGFPTAPRSGMKRYLPELVEFTGPSYDIGASGIYRVPGAIPLGPPNWIFPRDPIPAADDSVATMRLTVHFLIIAGIVNRNVLLGRIIKSDVKQPCEEKWFYPKTAE